MPTIRKVIAGKRAKVNGSNFENLLKFSAVKKMWTVTRIPDGCKQLGGRRLIRVRTPFDFVFTRWGCSIFVDAKTTRAKTFSRTQITPHQIFHLKEIEQDGFAAGYIVNFSTLNKTVFFSATVLGNLRHQSGLDPEQGIDIGTNEIVLLHLISLDQPLKEHLELLRLKKQACSPESRKIASALLESVACGSEDIDPNKIEP